MANMIDEILAQIPAEDLAARLGTDQETAMDAARKALPALLGGLDQEVKSGRAEQLGAAALQDHDAGLLEQPNPLAAVDATDGQKILGHMFGDQVGEVEQRLGGVSSADPSIFSKLLPLLAPLVMSWLSKRMGGALTGGSERTPAAEGGGLGDLLGGLAAGGAGGGIGDLLGGLLGGEMQEGKRSMPDLGGLFDMFGREGDGSDDDTEREVPDVGNIFGRS